MYLIETQKKISAKLLAIRVYNVMGDKTMKINSSINFKTILPNARENRLRSETTTKNQINARMETKNEKKKNVKITRKKVTSLGF